MEDALYFYSIKLDEGNGNYRLIDGTAECKPPVHDRGSFTELRDYILNDLKLDKNKAVFTAFNRIA